MTVTVNISSTLGSECRISDFLDSITAYTSIGTTLITASTSDTALGYPVSLEIVGSGFSFDSEGNVTGGTVSEIRIYANLPPVTLVSTATGLAVDASDLLNGNLATIELLIYGSDSFNYTGNAGDDTFKGGDKDDVLIGGAGADTLDGGAGIDTISYADSASAVTVNLATNVNVDGDAQGDTLDQTKAEALAGGASATDTLTVKSYDGTASHNINVAITGANDAATIAELGATSTGLDIVISNYNGGANGAIVSLNNGDGTFKAGSPVATGGSTHDAIALGDVNGDGQLDIVTAIYSGTGGTANVSLGNGDGTFTAGASVTTGGSPIIDITLGDVNGDGKLDIATTAYSYGVNISYGNGDGTFASGVTASMGGTNSYLFNGVALGDLNGDGKLDIVASGYYGAAYRLNTGGGTFAATTNIVTNGGIHNADVVLGDLNGDNWLDIVVTDRYVGVDVIINNGSGVFGSGVQLSMPGSDHFAVALGDLNGDGKLDIVTANSGGASIRLNTGGGTFAAGTPVSTGGGAGYAVVLGDVNGDGKLDIVTSAYHDGVNGARVNLGNGDGTFAVGTPVATGGSAHNTNSLALGDLDPALVIIDTKVTEAGGIANATLGDPSASGQLAVADPDTGEAKFQTPGSLAGTYGDFTFDADTGKWGYTLDQAKADKLADGATSTDTLTVTSYDGTASYDVTVDITGAGDNASIAAVAGGDYAVSEAGGTANGTLNDPSASGELTVTDPDSGEAKFQTPGSLAGTYGDFTFDADTGKWGYTLDQAKADKLTDGQPVTDTLTVKTYDGTATHSIVVDITGANDDASITANAGGDYAVTEAGGLANGTAGDPSASGQLTVTDADTGEAKFLTPGALSGTYGDFTFDAGTGKWGYTLDQSKADKLADGAPATDKLTVGSFDGTASYDITVDITGANDDASIAASGAEDTTVTEDGGLANGTAGDPSASGELTVTDPDAGEAKFLTPVSLDGTYGTFTFDTDSGKWGYTLDQSKADKLADGAPATDTLTVKSLDGTATYDIVVDITGINDDPTAPATNSVTTDEDTASAPVTIGASDVDLDTLSSSVKTGFEPAKGSVSFSGDTFTYTPSLDVNGTDSFTIVVSDGNGGSVEQAVSVTINPINDPPSKIELTSPLASTPENGGKELVAGITVTDDEQGINTLTLSGDDKAFFSIVDGGVLGYQLWFNGGANFEIPADTGKNNFYDVTVEVDDGTVGLTPDASASLALEVTDVPEAPAISPITGTVAENATNGTIVDMAAIGPGDDILTAFDPTTGGTVPLELINSADDRFVLVADGSGGYQLKVLNGALIDFEAQSVYTLTTRATNPLGTTVQDITVTIGDVDETTVTPGTTGGPGGDRLVGGSGNNTLQGLGGNDYIDGGLGADLMIGGLGDDVFVVDSSHDRVMEKAGEGIDTVRTARASYRLGANLENLVYTGPATTGFSGNGNALANTITGGGGDDRLGGAAGDDLLFGLDGNDRLDGGAGDDKLFGGAGNDELLGGAGLDTLMGGIGDDLLNPGAGSDLIVFSSGFGHDTVKGFGDAVGNQDILQFDKGLFADFAALNAKMAQVGANVVITLDAANTVTLLSAKIANIGADDFKFV